jgi:tetratricopeptide (TPR) repeat protein
MTSYTTRDVAKLLGLSEAQVLSHARVGYLSPGRGPRNTYRFSFQDLVLLRAAKALSEAHIAPQRIRRALRTLTRQLPAGRTLSAMRIAPEGRRVVVRDGGESWYPESGQLLLDFQAAEAARRKRLAKGRPPRQGEADEPLTVEQWFALAVDARVNLGRWLQADGHTELAVAEYRGALASQPNHPAAAFHLGTALEELGRFAEAIEAYRQALEADAGFAGAPDCLRAIRRLS